MLSNHSVSREGVNQEEHYVIIKDYTAIYSKLGPATVESKQEDHKFKAQLGYIGSSRPA